MADQIISAKTALATMQATDVIPIVDVSDTTEATSGTTKKIAASVLFGDPIAKIKSQVTPSAETVACVLTIAELLTGIITGTHAAGATQAYTLPSGALTDAGATFAVDTCIDWSLMNLSANAADTITLTSPGADHTIVGNPIVQSANAATGGVMGNSAVFRTRKTAAATFVTYRIS